MLLFYVHHPVHFGRRFDRARPASVAMKHERLQHALAGQTMTRMTENDRRVKVLCGLSMRPWRHQTQRAQRVGVMPYSANHHLALAAASGSAASVGSCPRS